MAIEVQVTSVTALVIGEARERSLFEGTGEGRRSNADFRAVGSEQE